MDNETKTRIFQSAKAELMRHSWDTFIDDPPSGEAGAMGVVIPGCPACHKRINTNDQYLRHLSGDVLPLSCGRLSRLPAFRLRNSDHPQRPDFAEFPETAPQRVRGRATITMNAAGFERTLPVSPCRPLY